MANTKSEALQILEMMQAKGVTVADINAAIKAQRQVDETFDLVCLINGVLTRIPFEKGRELSPVGIFPRKNLKFFLELDETGEISFPSVEEKREMPDDDLFTLISEVRPELNEKLRELGKPLVSGNYWLNGHEVGDHIGYWIAHMRDDKLVVDYDNKTSRAKVRKIGHI